MTNLASDFSGFYWFQFAVPLVTWGSLVGCVAGPLYAPAAWLNWVQAVMVAYILLASGHTWRLYCALRETHGVLAARRKRSEAGPQHAVTELEASREGEDLEALRPLFSSKTFYHVFVIPNYHEPVELLQATLDVLSRHEHAARRYVVVLAMEAHEEGHKQKAALLMEQYRSSFLHVLDTAHVKTEDEFGVSANSNYAMREAAHRLTGMGFTLEEVIVTKIDADAEVPGLYIDVLDQALQASDAPHHTVFTIPVLFERNSEQVPDITRVMDFNWGALCWQQMQNKDGLGWPVSNYSLSLKLLRDMDFLDTNQLAIAEDSHLFLKVLIRLTFPSLLFSHILFSHIPFSLFSPLLFSSLLFSPLLSPSLLFSSDPLPLLFSTLLIPSPLPPPSVTLPPPPPPCFSFTPLPSSSSLPQQQQPLQPCSPLPRTPPFLPLLPLHTLHRPPP